MSPLLVFRNLRNLFFRGFFTKFYLCVKSEQKMAEQDKTKINTVAPGPDDRTQIREESHEELTPARSRQEPPYLVIVDGPRTGARFSLGEGSNIIGRSPSCVVRLEDQSVSRQHSEVVKGQSGWMVKDLGSKNGTFVNGEPITEAVVVGHKDILKTGIYRLRLITQPTNMEEEMALPPEMPAAERTVFVSAAPESETREMKGEEAGEEFAEVPGEISELPQENESEPQKTRIGRRQIVLIAVLCVVLIAALAFFVQRWFFKPAKPSEKPPVAAVEQVESGAGATQVSPGEAVEQNPPQLPQAPGEAPAGNVPPGPPPAVSATLSPPNVQLLPVFLDFASSPLPAQVIFQGNELGHTPLKINVELEPGKTYQAEALFKMPEIGQEFKQQVEFTVEKDKPVIPILFRGPIGILKVMDLPRDVQFYLEGKFSYDKFSEQSAKLKEVVLQKPIYIPFGIYVMELKKTRQLGETSSTFVADIVYHREFALAEDNPMFTLEVKDEDLSVFPAKIRSEPSNADVFFDGKLVGKTPYDGILALGEHKLVLRKEGYFEHSEDLKVDINTPFTADVKLKTSVAGAHINNAKLAMNRQMYQEAINELAESLNSTPAPSEVALANYLLGKSYLMMNDIERAMGYFEQAKASEDERYPAMLGLANCYAILQRLDQALPLLVEVMLKAEDDETKRGANDLFQKISPFRSVVYIYSDPPGATVTVNDRPVAQVTPVILHDLSLGNYRLKVEKPGFLPTDLNITLSVNEFNPVIVKLRPIPQ